MAPEVMLTAKRASPAADVFSFGRLTYFLATKRHPSEDNSGSFMRMAKAGALKSLQWPEGLVLGAECKSLADKCLQFAPEARPTMRSVHKIVLGWSRTADDDEPVDWHSGLAQLRERVSLAPWKPTKDEAVCIMFDLVERDPELLFVSDSWVELFGAPKTPQASAWFSRSEWHKFLSWAQRQMFINEQETTVKYKELRGARPDGNAFRATMMVSFPRDISGPNSDGYLVQVSMEDILSTAGGLTSSFTHGLPTVAEKDS